MNAGDIYAGLQLVTAPTEEPMSVSDAETFLRLPIGDPDTDNEVSGFITSVRQHIEQAILRRALLAQTWKLFLKNWPGRDYRNYPLSVTSEVDYYYKYNFIKLPLPPLQSVTSVTYMNSSGQTLTLAPANFQPVGQGYNVLTSFEPGRIILPYAGIWPTDILMPGAPITITFVAGFPDQDTLGQWEGFGPLMQAMKLLLADCWENRIPPDKSSASVLAAEWLAAHRIYD